MRHQLSIVYFLALLLCSPRGNAQNHLFTLNEVWVKAEEYNKELKVRKLEAGRSEMLLKNAKNERLPEFNVNGSYSRLTNMAIYENGVLHQPTVVPVIGQSYRIGAEASFNLYRGGKANREIIIKKVELETALNEQQLSTADVKFRSAAYFYELLRNLQFKNLMVQEIANEEKQLIEIGHLYKNGTILKSDLLRAELKISNQKLTLSEIENNISLSVQQLNIMMGRADQAPLQPVVKNMEIPEPYALSYTDYLAITYKNSFELRLSENAVALSKLNFQQVKSNILPKVNLFASYGYTYPQSQFYPYTDALFSVGQAGVQVTMPISGFYLNKYKKEAAAIKKQEQLVLYEVKQDEIRNGVRTAYLHYTEALERIEVARKNIIQAAEALRILKSSYFNQQSLLTDLLDAETQLLQSKFDLTSAQVNAQVQFYQLQKITGKI